MMKLLFSVTLVLIMISGVQAGTTNDSSDLRCKAFAGTGDNYGIVAITDSYSSALNACDEMNYNCTISCSSAVQRSCKGFARIGRDLEIVAIANTEAGVAAACEARGKNCSISCGTSTGTSQGGGNAGAPGDR